MRCLPGTYPALLTYDWIYPHHSARWISRRKSAYTIVNPLTGIGVPEAPVKHRCDATLTRCSAHCVRCVFNAERGHRWRSAGTRCDCQRARASVSSCAVIATGDGALPWPGGVETLDHTYDRPTPRGGHQCIFYNDFNELRAIGITRW